MRISKNVNWTAIKKYGFIFFIVLSQNGFIWSQGFTTSDSSLIDANGNNFIMRGLNVPLAWFNSEVNSNIANIRKNTNANCLRIVLETDRPTDLTWQTCVNKCIENQMITMLELHDVTCSTDTTALKNMASWFASKADFLTDSVTSRYILINIANEWGDWNLANSNPAKWRDGYKSAVTILRNAGIKTTIVIDAPNCGQDIKMKAIKTYAQELINHDPQHNLLFSVHMYCEWKLSGNSSIATDLPAVRNMGIPIIVGEFGFKHSEGSGVCDVDEALILKTCEENGIGWLAWSLKGNGNPVQYLDMSSNWAATNLSSWGNIVVNGENGLKQTSLTASVFMGDSACISSPIAIYYQKNEEILLNDSIAELNIKDSIRINPQPDEAGQWNWIGPNNFTSSEREVFFDSVDVTKSGFYYTRFTNEDSCISEKVLKVNVIGAPGGNTNIVSGGEYKIVVKHSGKSLTVKNASLRDSALIEQRTYVDAVNQNWIVTDLGSGNYKIISYNSGKAMSVAGASIQDAAAIEQKEYAGTTEQQWQLISDSFGYFKIKNVKSKKYMEVSGSSSSEGVTVIQWASTLNDNQKFAFIRLDISSIENPVKENENVILFPNPAVQGKFTVLLNQVSGNSQLYIYDIRGNLVHQNSLIDIKTDIVTDITQGVYVLRIIDNQTSYTKKLLIEKN